LLLLLLLLLLFLRLVFAALAKAGKRREPWLLLLRNATGPT